MTMRIYEYFACPNGHHSEEKTSENDQLHSKKLVAGIHQRDEGWS